MASVLFPAHDTLEAVEQRVVRLRRATVGEAFPPRVALARGRGAAGVVAVSLAVFAILFGLVRSHRANRTDLAVSLALQRRRAPWFRRLMAAVSWPGFPPQSRIIPPALAAGWWLLGFPVEALFQALAWGATGISFAFKRIMRRPRPDHAEIRVAVARIGGTSFPSGHVLNYVSVYGFLAYALATLVRAPAARRVTLAALGALVAFVGPSRIYLGHHWATDVSASYLLGTSYLLALTAVYRRVKLRWRSR